MILYLQVFSITKKVLIINCNIKRYLLIFETLKKNITNMLRIYMVFPDKTDENIYDALLNLLL